MCAWIATRFLARSPNGTVSFYYGIVSGLLVMPVFYAGVSLPKLLATRPVLPTAIVVAAGMSPVGYLAALAVLKPPSSSPLTFQDAGPAICATAVTISLVVNLRRLAAEMKHQNATA